MAPASPASCVLRAVAHSRSSSVNSLLLPLSCQQTRQDRFSFSTSPFRSLREQANTRKRDTEKSYSAPNSSLNHNVTSEEESQFERAIEDANTKQFRTPWHREGSDTPPVERARSAGAMTKGKLLTTPTRLFKLILPLTTKDVNKDRKDVEPLALLVHPQQPLSYLERLIQSELPTIEKDGQHKVPDVRFWAVDSMTEEDAREGRAEKSKEADEDLEAPDSKDGAREQSREEELRGGPGEGGVESYSGAGRTGTTTSGEEDFVNWSKSTEIGDFVRDAARGKEFAVEIQGAPRDIRVGVPSFGDRTYYLRLRLRKKAKQIASMASIKKECDLLAHRQAHRYAYAGFGIMVGWCGIVAWLTFMTNLGWDVMEPVTYLVGLAGLIGGYGWFLLHNREASYRSAMNLTVTTRQHKLYESKGFDLQKWHYLVDEGNALRREIMAIANEYDVDWDESKDAKDEDVIAALKESRKEHGEEDDGGDKKSEKKERKKKKDDEDDD